MRPERFQVGDSRALHLVMPLLREVRAVSCPACGAGAGEPCEREGTDGRPGTHHRVRVQAAREAMRR